MTKQDGWRIAQRILGKNAAYRDNPKAPDAEARAQAIAEYPNVNAAYEALKSARDARYREVLANDAEYQRLVAETKAADKVRSDVSWRRHGKRLTLGRLQGVAGMQFFAVEAEGDNWEDAIRNLKAKQEKSA